MSLTKNSVVPMRITALSSDGNGVGHVEGMAVFVPFTAAGDEIEARIVKVCRTHAFGIIARVVTPSPDRADPVCPAYGRCGGCNLRHLTYEAECRAKGRFVEDALRRIGHLDAPVLPVIAPPRSDRYRNKVQYPLTVQNGRVCTGFFAPRSHRVVPCADCLLQPERLNAIARTVCRLLTELGVSVYDEETRRGLVRHLYLRDAVTTGEVLACLVVNGERLPRAREFCDGLRRAHPEVSTVVLNHNTDNTNVILSERCTVLCGEGFIRDELSGVPVRLGALSFYQVNTEGANLLYAEAARLAAVQPGETLLDLYCGAGTIGLSMARSCKKLIGVEIVPEAVESARENAAAMGVTHAEFFCADAGEAAQRLAESGLAPDVVVLDPPRKGCDAATIDAVARMAPSRIVMVSCNPATAARDAALLLERGYRTVSAAPVNLFPRTKHTEAVLLLVRDGASS